MSKSVTYLDTYAGLRKILDPEYFKRIAEGKAPFLLLGETPPAVRELRITLVPDPAEREEAEALLAGSGRWVALAWSLVSRFRSVVNAEAADAPGPQGATREHIGNM